jgi:hypothetical protein
MLPKRFAALLISLILCWTTVACSSSTPETQQKTTNNVASSPTRISDGKYPVQQGSYNDADGEYTLMLLNTPAGTPPVFRTTNLQMARLTDDEVKAKEPTYLEVNGDRSVMHLSEDFKFEYVHNVTETRTNPETGKQETVVVRQESNFWAPFAGALAGQALGSLLFTPQYYVPPVYQPGGVINGYGGYGNTYNSAVEQYQSRYDAPPPAVTNRQVLRTTGSIKNPPSTSTATTPKQSTNATKATGSGFGSNTLESSGKTTTRVKSPSSFGSGTSRQKSGFGSRKR